MAMADLKITGSPLDTVPSDILPSELSYDKQIGKGQYGMRCGYVPLQFCELVKRNASRQRLPPFLLIRSCNACCLTVCFFPSALC